MDKMGNKKILIVDDEPVNLEFFELMFSKLGFEVDRAGNGEEGLEKVREFEPDLILLDNIMPKLSGREVVKILKTNDEFVEYANIPVIMFSAIDDIQTKIEGFELGIEDYITKPFNFMDVLARVKSALRHCDLNKQIIQREERIALTERMNKRLTKFTERIKEPMNSVLKTTESLDAGNRAEVGDFLRELSVEIKRMLITIAALEEEVAEQRSQRDRLRENEISFEGLDKEYKRHFSNYSD
ncbi:MAG: response regulator transcription factor [Salinispira sp.]